MGIVGGFAVQEINQNTLCPVRLINDDINPPHIKSEKDKRMVCLGEAFQSERLKFISKLGQSLY